jgi:hypothetical protein
MQASRSYKYSKGQLILQCPYEMIVSSKIPAKLFPGFLESKKWSNQKDKGNIMLHNP